MQAGSAWLPIIREARQRVEYIGTAPAADVALSDTQIRGRHDERQRTLGADCEHLLLAGAQRGSRQTDPALTAAELTHIKARAVSLCHVCRFRFQQARQHQATTRIHQ